MVVDIIVFFIISTFVKTLRSCEFEVDNPVDGKDIKEEETMEVVDIRMYHFSAEIVHLLIDKWISRNNFELIFLWLVSGPNFYHWANINNIKKYLPEYHHRDFWEIIGLPLHLVGVLLLRLHLDDVMNLGVVKHIEYVKHLNVPTISTAYHNLKVDTLVESTKYFDINHHQSSISHPSWRKF